MATFRPKITDSSCPECGHAKHGEVCYNLASDGDCDCTHVSMAPMLSDKLALEKQIDVYEIEPHIAKFFRKRSQIPNFDRTKDIAITKDGNAYCALIGVNLQSALATGFGDSELHALMAMVEDRIKNFRVGNTPKNLERSTVYCVGEMD